MAQAAPNCEKFMAGETASIENIHSRALSISLNGEDGGKLTLELAPGQVISFTAGQCNAELLLHDGDPSCLRVIKPENAS
ncbi:MAG: hypothetical protein SV422_14050 [Pseudomonadota bacterium]|nr:hypothetical protein [Pseudomonadota bacterium]